jgi:dienelactone hydrolase
MPRQILLCVLGLCVACGTSEHAGSPTNDDTDHAIRGDDAGSPPGDDADGPVDVDDDDPGDELADASSGEAPDDGAVPRDPGDDDPPAPTAACGTDLEVHNGTVRPDFGEAGTAAAFTADPLADGPYQVLSHDYTLENPDPARADYQLSTYVPSEDGQNPKSGPLPLLLLLPGFTYKHTSYLHFSKHFASHGIVVLGISPAGTGLGDKPDNPANVAEVRHALDWLLSESPLAAVVDARKIGITGHSQGGKIAFFAAAMDARFKLVIGWDPQNGGGPPCDLAPLLGQDCNAWPVAPACDAKRHVEDPGVLDKLRAESLVFAARDTVVTNEKHMWAEHFYRGAPSPASLVLFPAAKHLDWTSTGAVTDVSKRIQLALVLTRFGLASGLERYLPTGEYAQGESSIEVHVK